MNSFRQMWVVTLISLRGLSQRVGSSLVTVVGVACAVAVMISILSVGQGVRRAIYLNDRADLVVVLPKGSVEYLGSFTRADVALVASAPGVKRGLDGKPIVQPLATVLVEVTKRSDGGTANIVFRGTGAQDRVMKPFIRVTQGRLYRTGVHELVVGKAAWGEYAGLDVGDHMLLRGTRWTIVGIYEADGGIDENAIASDADTVLSAFGRATYQGMDVQLESPSDFGAFKDALTTSPQLKVEVKRLTEYYLEQSKQIVTLFDFVGFFVGAIMAVGAVFGALTTMYSAVEARKREIATLRAIGFGGVPVAISVVMEALLLSVPGALIGALAATVLFDSYATSAGGVAFSLAVTPSIVSFGIVLALGVGLIGGIAPTVRVLRWPVADALRTT